MAKIGLVIVQKHKCSRLTQNTRAMWIILGHALPDMPFNFLYRVCNFLTFKRKRKDDGRRTCCSEFFVLGFLLVQF
jgi:hypothetical protein